GAAVGDGDYRAKEIRRWGRSTARKAETRRRQGGKLRSRSSPSAIALAHASNF
ncbi:hypothetical protein U1Q18_043518, partial [Sarracenia purpurea var. burkii]